MKLNAKQEKYIVRMLPKMSYRVIGDIIGIHHVKIQEINFKYNVIKDLMRKRKCVLCKGSGKFISDDLNTICQTCYDKINQATKKEEVSKHISAKKKSR